MRNSHKGILSAFLMGLSILVVMQLGSHTTTEIKLASEKTDVTDPKGNLLIKPSQIHFPEGLTNEEESSSLPATEKEEEEEEDPNNPENDPNNPGNGFGAGTAPSTGGLPVPKTKPETNPCEVEKAEKGNQLLKAAFGSEKSDCTEFNAEQKKLLKGESKSVPESAPGMQKSSSGMQNSLYYQWCTSRSRNAVIEVREEVTLCPKTFEQCIKTCGFPGNTLYGRTFCETIVGRKEVLSDFCDFPAPPARETRCAPTRPCTKYVQDVAPSCPAKVCDEGASTEIGSVYCTQSASGHAGASYSVGRQVEDSECTYWGHSKPSALTRYCPAAKPCTKYVRGTPPRCPSKACGVAANHVYGTVRCYTTATNVHVSDSECSYWGHSKPSARNLYCPAAKACTKYVQAYGGSCSTSCGHGAYTSYGSVKCEEVASGREVSDSECNYWNHAKPRVPYQGCAATAACQDDSLTCKCNSGCTYDGHPQSAWCYIDSMKSCSDSKLDEYARTWSPMLACETCPGNYHYEAGDIYGWGYSATRQPTCLACGDKCSSSSYCTSYQCSLTIAGDNCVLHHGGHVEYSHAIAIRVGDMFVCTKRL